MIEIQQAVYRGATSLNGRMCAAVDVVPLRQEAGQLTVYVAPIQSGGYEIVQVLQANGTNATSVNNGQLTQAAEPASSELFVEHDFGMDWNAKAHFLDNLLSCGAVREELEHQFGQ